MLFEYSKEKSETIINHMFQELIESRTNAHMNRIQEGICPYAVSHMKRPEEENCTDIECWECRNTYRERYAQTVKEALTKELQAL